MSAILKEVDKKIRALRGVVEFVTDIVVGSDGKFTALGAKTDDDDGNQLQGDTGWHLGFYSRPLDGATGAVVKPGGKGGAAFLFCWRNRQYEIALEKGDVAVANEAGAVSKWDKNGKITHTAASGQIVAINGENFALPKWDNFLSGSVIPVPPGTPYSSLAGVFSLILTALTTPCANGVPLIAPATPALSNLSDFIARISTDEYKSTKAKNG